MESYYRARNQQLFSAQLDFVSSLANPAYIAHLAQQGFLRDARFVRYLEHLDTTWHQPEYARFVRYPYALVFLAALQQPAFRIAAEREGWAAAARSQMLGHWSTWRTTAHTDENTAMPSVTPPALPPQPAGEQ